MHQNLASALLFAFLASACATGGASGSPTIPTIPSPPDAAATSPSDSSADASADSPKAPSCNGCDILADGLASPKNLVVASDALFFDADGSVYRLPKTGAAPVRVGGGFGPVAFDNNNNVFWTDGSAIYRRWADLSGTTARVATGHGIVAITIDPIDYQIAYVQEGAGIGSIEKMGHPPLVQSTAGLTSDTRLALEDPGVIWSDSAGIELRNFNEPTAAQNMPGTGPFLIVHDEGGAEIIWAAPSSSASGSTIFSSKNLGESVQTLFTTDSPVTSIAADASFIYWTESQSGSVWRGARDGSESGKIASAQASPSSIGTGDTGLFWANEGANDAGASGQIVHMPK